MAFCLRPPANVEGMLKLDREAFTSSAAVSAVRMDARNCNKMRKALARIILRKPRIKDIIPDPHNSCKKLLLLEIPLDGKDALKIQEQKAISESGGEVVHHELTLTYDHYTADQILTAVLPKGTEVTSSFETIGHIAHMNLKECHLPYREIIGQVILDKNPSIKTVVNKINTIEETFRFFKMELLAGEDNMDACVKQHGCTFEFDFSKVYWNSRLQTEHQRIVDILKPNDIVCDVFAGVGPFAIPAARKGCIVHANDLNPDSYKALKHNIAINKVSHKVHAYNIDGRHFLKQIFNLNSNNGVSSPDENTISKVNHVIMNLPAIAVEFLDVFKDTSCNRLDESVMIHCYCFSKMDDPFKDAEMRVQKILGSKVGVQSVHMVRNVAPKKVMMCISFQLLNLRQEKSESENGSEIDLSQKQSIERGIKRKAED